MLIRATGNVAPDINLITLGCSCYYLLGQHSLALVDCGVRAQLPALLKRIEGLGIQPAQITKLLVTHLHADRIGALPYLRRIYPNIQVYASVQADEALRSEEQIKAIYQREQELSSQFPGQNTPSEQNVLMDFPEYQKLFTVNHAVRDGDLIKVDEHIQARVFATPGHSTEGVAYFTLPTHYIIGSEVFGYFRGRGEPGPGGDHNIQRANESLAKMAALEFSGLCLPYMGALTGRLARKHMQQVVTTTNEILQQSKSAHANGISDEEVRESIWDSFYSPEVGDVLSMASSKASFEALWQQIVAARG